MSNGSTSGTLVSSLRAAVGDLAPGERLPSSRELIERFRVGPATVARAISQLAAEGLVVTRPGSGTYAARSPRPDRLDTGWQTIALTDRVIDTAPLDGNLGAVPEGTIMLDGGYLHRSLQPERALAAALGRAARRPGAWDRAPASGLEGLRAVFARVGVAPDDVLITGGGQSALSTAFRAIAAPGSPVLVESPTYPGALAAARAAGLRPVPVPIDHDGVVPDLLAEAFAMTGARLMYCQPSCHNPTGAVLSADRRPKVIEIVRAAGAFVLEDDFARHLGAGSRPLLADDRDGSVVYVTSLTKAAAPSLRIGAVVARGPVMERLRAIRRVDDFFVSRPLQEAALELVSSPAWDRHVRILAAALRDRRADLMAAVAGELPGWGMTAPTSGLHLWVEAPRGVDDIALAAAAWRAGVAVGSGARYFPAEKSGSFLRLSYAAAADRPAVVDGVRRLAKVVAEG